jgi:hypothetical protein
MTKVITRRSFLKTVLPLQLFYALNALSATLKPQQDPHLLRPERLIQLFNFFETFSLDYYCLLLI